MPHPRLVGRGRISINNRIIICQYVTYLIRRCKCTSAKWVPHMFSNENKQKFLDNGFQNIITGDETWFHFFTVSRKNDNKVWLCRDPKS